MVTDRFGGYYLPLSGETKTVILTARADSLGATNAFVSCAGGRQTIADIRLSGNLALKQIRGTVRDTSGHALTSALVAYGPRGSRTTTYADSDGSYTLSLPAGATGDVTASQNQYVSSSAEITSSKAGDTQPLDFVLRKNTGALSVEVKSPDGSPLEGVTISTFDGTSSVKTDQQGQGRLTDIPVGTALVTVEKKSYLPLQVTLSVKQGATVKRTITLPQSVKLTNPGFEQQDGTDGSKPAGWTITENPTGSAIRQDRTRFGGAPEGTYALSLWNEKAFTATVSQAVPELKAGNYYVRLHVNSGMRSEGLYIQALDSTGKELGRLGTTSGMNDRYGFSFALPQEGAVTLRVVSNGRAGEWAVIDDINLGYLGTASIDSGDGTPTEPDTPGHSGTSSQTGPGTSTPVKGHGTASRSHRSSAKAAAKAKHASRLSETGVDSTTVLFVSVLVIAMGIALSHVGCERR